MKRSILCLLVLLTLCVCILFVSCKADDPEVEAPDSADIGKEGVTETQKVPADPDYISPDNSETNPQQPGGTIRY